MKKKKNSGVQLDLTTPLLSQRSNNYSIQGESKDIILEVKEYKRKTAETKMSDIIMERKNYWGELNGSVSQLSSNHQKKQVGLGLGFLLACGLLGYFIYLAMKFINRTASDNNQLTISWYQEPINSTTGNMTCAVAYPSPPAGCDDDYNPVGVVANTSCWYLLERICDNCFRSDDDGGGGFMIVPLLTSFLDNPSYLVPESCLLGNGLPLGGTVIAILAVVAVTAGLGYCFLKNYNKNKQQVLERAGLFATRGKEAKLVRQKNQEINIFEILNQVLRDKIGGDIPLHIIFKYLDDDSFFEYKWQDLQAIREQLTEIFANSVDNEIKDPDQRDTVVNKATEAVMEFIPTPNFSFC